LLGMVPLCAHRGTLPFLVAGHSFFDLQLQQVDVLGGEPLLPPEVDIHDRFFLALEEAFPNAENFLLNSVSCSSFVWRYLQESSVIQNRYLPYVIHGTQNYHVLSLPPTFNDYLAEFGRKKRYNLKRQLRVLRENCGKELDLVRIESRTDIDLWLEARHAIDQSPQPIASARTPSIDDAKAVRYRRLADVADRGLLRHYILRSAGQFIACISGCQYRDIYNIWDIIYNKRFADFSPGTSILYLAIEDLLRYRPVKTVNFGFGDPQHSFSTQTVVRHAKIALFRKTLRNRFYRASHSIFRSCVESVKRVTRAST
jgi:hypothetical protein